MPLSENDKVKIKYAFAVAIIRQRAKIKCARVSHEDQVSTLATAQRNKNQGQGSSEIVEEVMCISIHHSGPSIIGLVQNYGKRLPISSQKRAKPSALLVSENEVPKEAVPGDILACAQPSYVGMPFIPVRSKVRYHHHNCHLLYSSSVPSRTKLGPQ